MGIILSVPDVLGVIYKFSNYNHHALILNQEVYKVVLGCAQCCPDCNKLISIFNHTEWITDDDAKMQIGCHNVSVDKDKLSTYKQLLKKYPYYIQYLCRCPALEFLAVQTDSRALQWIKHPSKFLINFVLTNDIRALQWINDEDLFLDYIDKFGGKVLEYIKYQNERICWRAVRNSVASFKFVNSDFQSDEMIDYVLEQHEELFQYIVKPKEKHYLWLYEKDEHLFQKLVGYRLRCGLIAGGQVAMGSGALLSMTNGSYNTAVGSDTLRNITSGNEQIAIGNKSGINLIDTDNTIMIGNRGTRFDSSLIRIGNTTHQKNYQAGIFNNQLNSTNVKPVYIDADGQLGTH